MYLPQIEAQQNPVTLFKRKQAWDHTNWETKNSDKLQDRNELKITWEKT